ncbi:glycosyl hydrolase [Microbacterium sp. 2FI]|uniref:FIMAH domain-containing protein n=1 Tax=Microbacterium sp. 2FI TaxID=2502193 RepID=UPI0014859AB1|nr:glycosyl hydrolase [Microbacterium sp. 2FI]
MAALAITLAVAPPTHAAELSTSAFSKTLATPASSNFADQLESKYIDPDRVYSTDVRWWLGDAAHTDESLLAEIQALYDAGFRGVELEMQDDRKAPNANYGYGSPAAKHKWNLMMHKLLDLGMGVYLTSGANWATHNVPGLDPTSQAAMQNLTLGTATVNAGAALPALTAPAANQRRVGAEFVTAYAYRVVEGNTVDPDSYVDLSQTLTQGASVWEQNSTWTAPSDGTYRVFGLWTQGTFQTSEPSVAPAYAVNYFDKRGLDALKVFWEDFYLDDPTLVEKIKHGDVQLFMDSIEIHAGGGNEHLRGPILSSPQFTWWTDDMVEEFKLRKGYDITPHLFLIAGVKSEFITPYQQVGWTGTYRLAEDEARRQSIINDYQDVLTQLYMERLIQPMTDWMNSNGIKTRAQMAYGRPFENSELAMAVDYPEAENYAQANQVDLFRTWTGAAKLENKVLSTETGAAVPLFSGTAQRDLEDAYSQYAAGFQRIIWHVWGSEYTYGEATWPGHNATNYRQLGTRTPSSADYDEFNAHLGRVQQLLQTGQSRTDVGFINQKWIHGVKFRGGTGNVNQGMNWQLAHQGVHYRSTELQDNGYTYDYFSPRFLFDEDVSFNEETKTIEQAGYKAVVLYQDWLELEGAERLLDWAKKGLKVVILGDAAARTPFNDGKNAELQQVISELKAQPTVRTATVADPPAGGYFSSDPGGYDDNVLEQLQDLGVEPYSGFSEPNLQLLSQTRSDEAGNEYVYLYNYDDGSYASNSVRESVRNAVIGDSIATEVVQDGLFVPYKIDAWTGEVTELANYRWEDGKTVLPIALDHGDISLLAFEKVSGQNVHIVSTDAESAHAVVNGVAVRATETGNVTTELSNGTDYVEAVTVPLAYDITDWDLTVQSWRPNAVQGDLVLTEEGDGLTTVNRATSTIKTPVNVQLETLTTWDQIPEVGKAVSGTGHYEASFTWDADVASGAYLDFGKDFESSMKVWINGEKVGGDVSTNPTKVKRDVGGLGKPTIDDGTGNQVPLVGQDLHTGGVNWSTPITDVSDYLVDGENKIVIEYNSVLSNVQLDRGVIREQLNLNGWFGNDQKYLAFGPQQAKIVPFVEVEYSLIGSIADPLAELRAAGDITNGAKTSLQIRLDRAATALAAGDDAAALGHLRDFVKHVPSVVKDKDARSVLIQAAEGVIAELEQRLAD